MRCTLSLLSLSLPSNFIARYFIDVEMQMHSKEFARKFNQYNPPKNVDFVMAWLLELIEREGRPLYVSFFFFRISFYIFAYIYLGVA